MTAPRSDAMRRRRLVGTAAAALAVAVMAVLALVLPGSSNDRPAASTSTPAATTTSSVPEPPTEAEPPAPVVPGPTEGGDSPPPILPAVTIDEPAAAGDGVSASVHTVEAIEGSGFGPGNIAGPALRITVRLSNNTGAPVALDGVAVDLSTGAEATPASPLEDPSRDPFSGTVAPGDTAEGVYVFTVPTDQRDLVTVSVGYRPGAPLMVFTGSV
jgi:hypothetical protein